MDISFGGIEWLSQAERPQRAQPLDLLFPGKKWLYPCCLETRDSVLLRNLCLFTAIFFPLVWLHTLYLKTLFHMSFCISPSTHSCPLTQLDFIYFFVLIFLMCHISKVSRTTEASALRFCDAPANLSSAEVLATWRNHLHPNRLQIGEAVVFCCVLSPPGLPALKCSLSAF